MKRTHRISLVMLGFLLASPSLALIGGGFDLTWNTLDGGGGSSSGGAFTLSLGSLALPYEVQWNGASGHVSGTSLSPGATLTGLTSTATQQACGGGGPDGSSAIRVGAKRRCETVFRPP